MHAPVQIGNFKKIHDGFLWGPHKIEINEKIKDTICVLFNTPCLGFLNTNASSEPIYIFIENLLISTQIYCFKGNAHACFIHKIQW